MCLGTDMPARLSIPQRKETSMRLSVDCAEATTLKRAIVVDFKKPNVNEVDSSRVLERRYCKIDDGMSRP